MAVDDAHRTFSYRELMPYRVSEILLLASAYDSFILEEDGRFSDQLLSQYLDLQLPQAPHLHHVTSSRQALAQLRKRKYDLVITTPHFAGGIGAVEFATKVRSLDEELPVVMLTYDRADAQMYCERIKDGGIDRVFLWTGDPALLLALVKSVEDFKNADQDSRKGLVRVIIVIEDSPAYYSSFLPLIYREVMAQTRSLIAERLNDKDRHYRTRARPKILLARSYEQASALFKRYKRNLLGVITDLSLSREGTQDPKAGIRFIKKVRRRLPDLPILVQSAEDEGLEQVLGLQVAFAEKDSPDLLGEVRRFMWNNFGFGPFIFQMPEGTPVARAESMHEMVECLRRVPDNSLRYHAERNHISNWLMARTEFQLALEVRPVLVEDFDTVGELRTYIVDSFTTFLEHRQRGQIIDFSRQANPLTRDFTRIGKESMGGKARGIAFMSTLLAGHAIHKRFPDVRIIVPRTVSLCTDIFDQFCEKGNLRSRSMTAEGDEEISEIFLSQPLDPELEADLSSMLADVHYPLAVRSSSLHEDSEFHPLAGLYRTFIIPNSSRSVATRLEQLSQAIRLVWASTFFRGPLSYMEAHQMRVEEEKMAVIIQRVVGQRYGDRFYPTFSGVTQSFNYYPLRFIKPEDGVATVALGLGQTVAEGRKAYRFSPRHPQIVPQMSVPADMLRFTQREFFALDLSDAERQVQVDETATLDLLGLEIAEQDGTLASIGATYSPDNNTVYDTIYRNGVRVVNFSGVLKHGRFPLADLLTELMEIGREGMGNPVEIEFAVSLEDGDKRSEMGLVQMRPLGWRRHQSTVVLEAVESPQPPVIAGPGLGNGVISEIKHVIYLHPDRADFSNTALFAQIIARWNDRLAKSHRPYILIGPGRWGSADRWLGIPVSWGQVSAARVIVELEMPNAHIDPSQGTHFFHNITSLQIGYFCIDASKEGQVIDLEWLDSIAPVAENKGLRLLKLPTPLSSHIDGRSGQGLVVVGDGVEIQE